MHPDLLGIVEDFERLWGVAGFAEQFAASLAQPHTPVVPGDPYHLVLDEHHRRLVAALRRAQQRGEVRSDRGPGDLADALAGFYLSRRLSGASLDGWARTAIAAISISPASVEDHRWEAT